MQLLNKVKHDVCQSIILVWLCGIPQFHHFHIDTFVKMCWSIGSLLTAVVVLRFWPNEYFTLNYLKPMDKIAGRKLLDADVLSGDRTYITLSFNP